ncbi:hypothetical protein D0Z03_000823 [Geotrichum reessii]|nr:hypothetical protein D0Z03_000823 [Galactomyces reessii]
MYGKDNVRVLKVKRDPQNPAKQEVIELTVRVFLEGEIEEAYTKADNASIVPTDTVKNTVYILAKQYDVWPIERFGAALVNHFVTKYAHIHGAEAHIIQHRWVRYNVQGAPHPHSFIQDGKEVRTATVYTKEGEGFKITSGIKNLTVLKSTGSMFYGYNVCDFTTLKETYDRILSTDVDAQWTWLPNKITTYKAIDAIAAKGEFDAVYENARNITLEIFALENSASVQATMYNISERLLKEAPLLDTVTYLLPNKHFVELDLSWHHGLQNTGKDAEVYVPLSNPNGLIKSVVKRTSSKL